MIFQDLFWFSDSPTPPTPPAPSSSSLAAIFSRKNWGLWCVCALAFSLCPFPPLVSGEGASCLSVFPVLTLPLVPKSPLLFPSRILSQFWLVCSILSYYTEIFLFAYKQLWVFPLCTQSKHNNKLTTITTNNLLKFAGYSSHFELNMNLLIQPTSSFLLFPLQVPRAPIGCFHFLNTSGTFSLLINVFWLLVSFGAHHGLLLPWSPLAFCE